MTTEELNKQRETLFDLVKYHFFLDKDSIAKFRERLFNPYIPPEFKDLVDENLRVRMKIEEKDRSSLDGGWNNFCSTFFSIKEFFGIKYEDFIDNKIKYNGNVLKLSAAFDVFYNRSYGRLSAIDRIDRDYVIKENKRTLAKYLEKRLISKGSGDLVLSFNFIDWFLCSTGESWSSCMSLESDNEGSYWAGLPGFIVDPNRVLLYISSGKMKEYVGLNAERMLLRSWGFIDDNKAIHLSRFYPFQMDIEDLSRVVKNRTGFEVSGLIQDYRKSIPFKMLRHETGDTCFGYVDYLRIVRSGNGKDFYNLTYDERGGYGYFDKDEHYNNADLFHYRDGFSKMVLDKENLGNFVGGRIFCSDCGDEMNESEVFYSPNGNESLCEHCFEQLYFNCERCGKPIDNEDCFKSPEGDICNDCFNNKYFNCEICEKTIDNEDCFKSPEGDICNDCFNNKYFICEECQDVSNNRYLIWIDEGAHCTECAEQLKKQKEEQETLQK